MSALIWLIGGLWAKACKCIKLLGKIVGHFEVISNKTIQIKNFWNVVCILP